MINVRLSLITQVHVINLTVFAEYTKYIIAFKAVGEKS